MPIEIRELVIRAVVDGGADGAPRRSAGDAAHSDHATPAAIGGTRERAAIVEAAVKEVLRILKATRER